MGTNERAIAAIRVGSLIQALVCALLVIAISLALQNPSHLRRVPSILKHVGPGAGWCSEAEQLNPGWRCPESRQPDGDQ